MHGFINTIPKSIVQSINSTDVLSKSYVNPKFELRLLVYALV